MRITQSKHQKEKETFCVTLFCNAIELFLRRTLVLQQAYAAKGKRDVLFSFKINYKLKGIGVNVQAVARPGEKLVVGHLIVVGSVECSG